MFLSILRLAQCNHITPQDLNYKLNIDFNIGLDKRQFSKAKTVKCVRNFHYLFTCHDSVSETEEKKYHSD